MTVGRATPSMTVANAMRLHRGMIGTALLSVTNATSATRVASRQASVLLPLPIQKALTSTDPAVGFRAGGADAELVRSRAEPGGATVFTQPLRERHALHVTGCQSSSGGAASV
jgi:hypothetical protein